MCVYSLIDYSTAILQEREEKHYGTRRLPIILTKPDSEREKDRTVKKIQENQEKPLSQPTIILRTRDGDNRAVSPSQRSIAVSRLVAMQF